MDIELDTILGLLAALAIGLLIGLERGWSGRQSHEEFQDQIAGMRTFSLIGLTGAVWVFIAEEVAEWILVLVFAVVATLVITSYIFSSRRTGDIGTTTSYAKLLTFALAAWAASGSHLLALGTTVVVIALLGTKPALHRWVGGIETKELYAGIKMLLISLVLLPLLPDQGYGPWEAINPRWVWWMVVLICGISFIGYFAIKYIGNRKGTIVTCITGGLASSTAVTLSMAEFAKGQKVKALFMGGVMIASTIMFFRIMVEVAIVNAQLLNSLWLPLLVMAAGVLSGAIWFYRSRDSAGEPEIDVENPFKLSTALKFGAFLTLILLLSAAMQEWFGNQGIYILSVISGIMDVNAITLSLSRMALNEINHEVAVFGIILAAFTNTLSKSLIFAFFTNFRQSLLLIGLMALAGLAGLATAAFSLL